MVDCFQYHLEFTKPSALTTGAVAIGITPHAAASTIHSGISVDLVNTIATLGTLDLPRRILRARFAEGRWSVPSASHHRLA